MNPILYESRETDFNHNGLGKMNETLSAIVTEVANGEFELEVVYPIGGRLYKYIQDHMLIKAKPNSVDDPHVFRIYEHTVDTVGQIVTIHAHTKSNDLGQNLVKDVVISSLTPQEAMNSMKMNLVEPTDYSFVSDITTRSSAEWKNRNPLNCIAGEEGSLIHYWGGEIKRDNRTIYLYRRRGRDNVAIIRDGKNINGLSLEYSTKGMVTKIIPYRTYTPEDSENEVVEYGTPVESQYIGNYPLVYVRAIDYSNDDDVTSLQTMNTKASRYFTENNGVDKPSVNVSMSLVELSDSSEYEKFKDFENVELFDSVTVYSKQYDINIEAKITALAYDSLAGKNISLEMGSYRTGLIESTERTYMELIGEKEAKLVQTIQVAANGKNRVFRGVDEPTTGMVKNDLWYKPVGDGETEMYQFDGAYWQLILSTLDTTNVQREVDAAIAQAEEAKQEAENAYTNAVTEAKTYTDNQNTIVEGKIAEVENEVADVKETADKVAGEINAAISNAGFTSLSATIQNVGAIATNANQNAQQAISDASSAHGLAQTSISEAQTAQANSLTALGKADNALDGVSSLNVRVDDVEAELAVKADNTFMNEDGELTTLSNAITFNSHRFSSDMSRIESRVESLAGEVNLVILRGSIENRLLYGGEVFPNSSGSTHSNVMGELIKVVGGESFALSKEMTGSDDRWRINFYDENHNFISRFHPPANTQDIMVAPSGARYMWVSYPKDSKPQITRGTDFVPYRPNLADQMTVDEVTIFRNEYDEFADKTERRLTAIDSSNGRLSTAELLITQTAQGLDLKADQTTVNELTGVVESLGTEFDIVAGQVSSKVWKTDIDNIEIGGRNYFSVSKLTPRPYIGADYPSDRVYHFNLEPETEYVISTSTNLVAFRLKNGGDYYIVPTSETNDKGHKLTTDSTGVISIGFWQNEVDEFISGRSLFKIEKGNKATDWTPAPEDTDAKIDYIETEWTQTFNTFSQTVSGIDGRVTAQKQTIDTISNTVSGHDGRISTVEQTAQGLQTTVASKANQSQVTQLADGYNILVAESYKSLVAKDLSDNTSGWILGGNVEYQTSIDNLAQIYVTGSNPDTLYGGNRIYVNSVLKIGRRYKITLDVWTVGPRNISIGQADSSNNVRLTVDNYTKTYEVIYEAPNANGFSIYFHDEGTYRIGNITVVESTAISQSQISVLQNNINLRVTKGEVVSQLNIDAGRVLIQTNKLLLDANTYIMGTTFVNDLKAKSIEAVNANIASIRTSILTADVITSSMVATSTALITKIFATDATVTTLTSRTAFINSVKAIDISADRITAGTINAADVNIINLNVSKLVGDTSNFVQSAWNGINNTVTITSAGIKTANTSGQFVEYSNGGLTFGGGGERVILRNNTGTSIYRSGISLEPVGSNLNDIDFDLYTRGTGSIHLGRSDLDNGYRLRLSNEATNTNNYYISLKTGTKFYFALADASSGGGAKNSFEIENVDSVGSTRIGRNSSFGSSLWFVGDDLILAKTTQANRTNLFVGKMAASSYRYIEGESVYNVEKTISSIITHLKNYTGHFDPLVWVKE